MVRTTHMVPKPRLRKTIFRIGGPSIDIAILLPFLMAELLAFPVHAQTAVWVQAVSGGFEARVVTNDLSCPDLVTGTGTVAMTSRAIAGAQFPLLCVAPLAANLTKASVGGVDLPLPKARPQRILVLGDTGCRIATGDLQDCNDSAKWPFPAVAAAAANLKPDLVIHLGDYLYRESPCPPNNAGCAGSPWGDNWTTWAADFFTPAAPLLAAAPWVITRGNHETCDRAGEGYTRLLGPDAATACTGHVGVHTIDLGGLTLAVMDDADAPDREVNQPMLPTFASELAGLGKLPGPVWFVHHRPIWSPISGPLGIPIGGNRTLIAAAGKTLIPSSVQLMLSGHIHAFEAMNYYGDVPPQIVAGNGGGKLHSAPRNLKGSIFQGSSGVAVRDGLSVGGFGFLLFTRDGDNWTVDLFNPDGTAQGQCRLTAGGEKPRIDCPTLAPK